MGKLVRLGRVIRSNWKWNVSVAFLAIAAYDTWIDELTVIAATFLALAALPWVIDIFDRITLPGGVEIDFKKVNQILNDQKVEPPKSDPAEFSFLTDDPNLALVALRIEIEKRLRLLQRPNYTNRKSQNIYTVISELVHEGQLNEEVGYAIRDMLPAMNRAAHGEEVSAEALSWVRTDGLRLLSAIPTA